MKLENEIYTIFIDNKRYDLNVIDMINYVNQPLKTLIIYLKMIIYTRLKV